MQQLALPAPAGPTGDRAQESGEGTPGYALKPALSRKVSDRLTALGRIAASRFNERSQLAGRPAWLDD